eukprot:TRINITY_DN11274_c0_g1_i1.p1 TRINITY_DN11274_c0_g1~~TRINITY_DN11274_c0_g1_i1.p1  ORF type:complete len:136 (+),score=11.97 TRINITY_DN11274_c0_g1_i1:54-461(+)
MMLALCLLWSFMLIANCTSNFGVRSSDSNLERGIYKLLSLAYDRPFVFADISKTDAQRRFILSVLVKLEVTVIIIVVAGWCMERRRAANRAATADTLLQHEKANLAAEVADRFRAADNSLSPFPGPRLPFCSLHK